MNRKAAYPAIFHYEDGGYWVEMPDVEGFVTQGNTIEHAWAMAKECMELALEDVLVFPEASPISEMEKHRENEKDFISIVFSDTIPYVVYDTKAVKKTLTIPGWLNKLALKHKINFSETLKEGLISKLNL